MLGDLIRGFGALGDPGNRRALWLSILSAVVVLIALVIGATWLVAGLQLVDWVWLDWVLDILGGLAAAMVAIVLFPATVGIITGFFLDEVAGRVERRDYPWLGPPRTQRVQEVIGTALRFFLLLIGFNLLALILVYFVPVLNVFIFLVINGYLLGREYFEMVALRRMEPVAVRQMRKRFGGQIFITGLIIALLLIVPLVNLLVPIVATAFMVHVFHRKMGSGMTVW